MKRKAASGAAADPSDSLQQLAFDALLSSVSDAFDLKQEDPRLVEQYDTKSRFPLARIDKKWNNYEHYKDHGSTIGKLLLMARRLCERGCGFVTVTTSFVWDMHADVNNATMTEGMDYVGAPFDHALSTLIDDIESRGLSDRIMVVCLRRDGPDADDQQSRRSRSLGKPGSPTALRWRELQETGDRSVVARWRHTQLGSVTIPDLVATIMHKLMDLDQVRVTGGIPRNLLEVLSRGKPFA